jgi:hypothetical protein
MRPALYWFFENCLQRLPRPASQTSLTEFLATALPRTQLVLGGLLLLFGIAAALSTAWIVYTTFSPILFFDQWTVVNEMMESHGRLTLAQLWELHNEHRIPWGKLAGYVDLKVFGGRNISQVCEIYLVQILESLFFIWIFRRYRGVNLSEVTTAAGLFVFAMFYPIQIENFYWGFQIAFVMAPFAAAVSIGAAIVHSDLVASREHAPWCSWALVISLACALLAETSLASGILIWPLLWFLSFILRMPAKTKSLIAVAGAIATGAFLWGFHSPGNTANPLDSLRHPIAVGKFVRALLAWSWDPATPTASLWPTFAQLCTTIAVVVVVIVFLRMARPVSKPDKLQLFLLANAVFLLTTAFIVALGRINFGIQQAVAGRYQTIALAFWACFGALLLLWRTDKTESPARLIEIQIALLLLFLAGVPRFVASMEVARAHQRVVAQSYLAVLEDPSNSGARANISPYPNVLVAHAYLQSQHLGLQDGDFLPAGVLAPISPVASDQLKVNGFRVLPPDQCIGHMDWVKLVPGKAELVEAAGWAWTAEPAEHPRRILLVLDDGAIVGSGKVSRPRPDVRQQVAGVTELNTGWTARASLPRGRTLRAFIVSDALSVCPVPNEFVPR